MALNNILRNLNPVPQQVIQGPLLPKPSLIRNEPEKIVSLTVEVPHLKDGLSMTGKLHATLKNKNTFFYRLRKRFSKRIVHEKTDITHPGPSIVESRTFGDIKLANEFEKLNNRRIVGGEPMDAIIDSINEMDVPEETKKQFTRGIFHNDGDFLVRGHKPLPPVLETCDTTAQTDWVDVECDTADLQKAIDRRNQISMASERFGFVRKLGKCVLRRKVKDLKAYTKLTWYLKCKHAFAAKTLSLITTMRNDARVWMATNDYKMESEDEYLIITNAVIAAMRVDQQDVLIKASLSDNTDYNLRYDHNSMMMDGVLGKKCAFGKTWKGTHNHWFTRNTIRIRNNIAPL